MWSKVFGYSHKPMTAWDLKKKVQKQNGIDTRTCYKNLAIGIYGPAAPMTVNSWDTPCSRTALVRSYSDFVIRGLNLQSNTSYMLPKPKHEIRITFMVRVSEYITIFILK